MKLKHLIIIFCLIIIFFLFALFTLTLLPVLLTGAEFTAVFHRAAWPVFFILFLVMAGLLVFFLLNYRLLSLLEREDWPALSYYLEQKIYGKNRYRSRDVRLLAVSYLVTTDYPAVLRLESKVAIAKPSVVQNNALIFGTARVLSGDYGEAAVFFKSNLGKGKLEDNQWIYWFYGFSLMLAGDFAHAETEFLSLASSSNVLIGALASYFLYNTLSKYSLKRAECRAAAEESRQRIKTFIKNPEGWNKETEKTKTQVHATIITRYIKEAGIWLFKEGRGSLWEV